VASCRRHHQGSGPQWIAGQ